MFVFGSTDAKLYRRFSREVVPLRKKSIDADVHKESAYKQLKDVINETDYYGGSEDLVNVTDYLEYLPDYYEGDIINYEYNDESDRDSGDDFSDYYGSDSESSDSDYSDHTPDYYSIDYHL